MRLAEQLASSDWIGIWPSTDDDGAMREKALTHLRRPVIRVTADEVWQFYWQWEKDEIDMRDDFGPLRLPYPAMWIEGRTPALSYADGHWRDGNPRLSQGILIEEHPNDSSQLRAGLVTKNGPVPVVFSAVAAIRLGDTGRMLSYVWLFPKEVQANDRRLEVVGREILRPALLALSFMNCKNVGLVADEARPKLERRFEQRHGTKKLRFSRIVLPHLNSGQTVKSSLGGTKSLHLIRGHFKTYTDEKKLFGKHTGTYWWDWHATGDPSKGVVVPSYEVGVG